MTLALALIATSYVSPEAPSAPLPSAPAIFKPARHPDRPNLIQKALVFFTGTQQNHWTIENMAPYYGSYLVPIPGIHPYIQRGLCGRDGEKVFKNGTKDLFLRYVPVLNSIVQFFYMPSATNKLLKDIQTECAELGIQNGISRGSIPENENYLLLLRPANYRLPGTLKIVLSFLAYFTIRKIITSYRLSNGSVQLDFTSQVDAFRKHLESTIDDDTTQSALDKKEFSQAGKRILGFTTREEFFDTTDAYVTGGAFALFLISRYCFYFNRYIIPYSTIEKLSPELQERCYDLMWLHK